ncbi:MAG: NAD(P)-dependent oxidoreductase [Bacteroidota bacterium]
MKFNKIVAVDPTGIRPWAIEALKKFTSGEIQVFSDIPPSDEEILQRIGDAECVLVSWNTRLSPRVMGEAPKLRYVGMCCSLFDEASSNVHIPTARQRNIEVRGIYHYGDEGMIEFILAELIRLAKGIGENQWQDEPVELYKRKLGIIGLGTTGQMLAQRARGFNMDLYYYSRSRKYGLEEGGMKYLPLPELLREVEIVSLHLPRNTRLMDQKEFDLLGDNKILVNTSLGLTFSKTPFLNWVERKGNFAILDGVGMGPHKEEFETYDNIILTPIVSGWTLEAKDRLSQKVIENIHSYMNSYQVVE